MSDKTPAIAPNPRLSDYYSATQIRNDRWNALKSASAGLLKAGLSGAATAQLAARVAKLLTALEPIEMYWAFPGRERFARLREMLAEHDHRRLAREVGRVVQALNSGSYRRRFHMPDSTGHQEETDDQRPETHEERVYAKPYLEVLFVDQMQTQQEDALGPACTTCGGPKTRSSTNR